jgi:hypothetical protein
LADFLLRHRAHIGRDEQDEQPDLYRPVVFDKDERFVANVRTRAFLYELTPSVPIKVLPDNIRSDERYPVRLRSRPPRSSGGAMCDAQCAYSGI